jgi:hypothetical protein
MENKIERRSILKASVLALGGTAVGELGAIRALAASKTNTSQVFFTPDLNSDALLRIYSKINDGISGKVAIKLHTGEPHGPNILPREMVKALQQHIPNSCLVETNTLYKGKRYTTPDIARPLRSMASISVRSTLWTRTAQ